MITIQRIVKYIKYKVKVKLNYIRLYLERRKRILPKSYIWKIDIGHWYSIISVQRIDNNYVQLSNIKDLNELDCFTTYTFYLKSIDFVDFYLYLEKKHNDAILTFNIQKICDHEWGEDLMPSGWNGGYVQVLAYHVCKKCNKQEPVWEQKSDYRIGMYFRSDYVKVKIIAVRELGSVVIYYGQMADGYILSIFNEDIGKKYKKISLEEYNSDY